MENAIIETLHSFTEEILPEEDVKINYNNIKEERLDIPNSKKKKSSSFSDQLRKEVVDYRSFDFKELDEEDPLFLNEMSNYTPNEIPLQKQQQLPFSSDWSSYDALIQEMNLNLHTSSLPFYYENDTSTIQENEMNQTNNNKEENKEKEEEGGYKLKDHQIMPSSHFIPQSTQLTPREAHDLQDEVNFWTKWG